MRDNRSFTRCSAASDLVTGTDLGTAVRLEDTDGNVFGVFPSPTTVKYTEANGAEPSVKKIGTPSCATASQNGRHDGSSKPFGREMRYAYSGMILIAFRPLTWIASATSRMTASVSDPIRHSSTCAIERMRSGYARTASAK